MMDWGFGWGWGGGMFFGPLVMIAGPILLAAGWVAMEAAHRCASAQRTRYSTSASPKVRSSVTNTMSAAKHSAPDGLVP